VQSKESEEARTLPASRREQGLRFVRRMYLPRAIGLALGGVAIAGVLIANGAPGETWAALFFSTIVWPHIALWIGSRSRNPFRTELASLMVDSALGGAWIALMQFNLLPSVALLIMLSMDKMAVGGASFLARCTAALAVICAAVSALTGFEVRPDTSMVQIIGSLPLLILYPLVVGLTTYRLARRLREQNQLLSEESRTDGLSGLLNRRYWEEAVSAEYQRWRRYERPTSLLMLDIDHFKLINDRYGHPVGDEVIRNVAAILRAALREEDVPGRYGGEEFGILLPDTAAAGAEVIAERIRRRIEGAALAKSGLRATVSIGIAEISAQDLDYTVCISHADRALYAAKERGRNRSVRFQPSFTPRPEPI
jgi:diguanylate cyclase